ncbi:MAG: 2-dehydropantoate 2-reductase [Pseudomonadota bacterium]
MFDYTILGAGAIGCVYGGRLAEAGHKVQLITRSADLGNAIDRSGLVLEMDGAKTQSEPVARTADKATESRVVIVLTKTFQTKAAIEALQPQMSEQTVWVTLQNGLGNGTALADLTGGPVLEGPAMMPARIVKPGHIWTQKPSESALGPYKDTDPSLAETIAAEISAAGIPHIFMPDARPVIWKKACFNLAMNAIAALTAGGPGLIAATKGLQQEAHLIASEGADLAEAKGIAIDRDALAQMIDWACATHIWHKPSMRQDIEAGALTEIDALNGYIAAEAPKYDLAVPRNQLLAHLVRARETAPAYWAGKPA